MPATIEEPPVTTSSLPSKPSFLADPEFEKSLQEALHKDGKMDAIAPMPEKPAEPAKPATPEPTKPATAEPPKPSETKPGQAPADDKEDDIPPDIKSPETQSSWKRLKESKKAVEKERDTVRGERDTLKAELDELRKKATTPAQKRALEEEPEYQALKKLHEETAKEVEAYSERLALLDVERHPKFVAYFEEKTNAQLNMAKAVGGDKALEILKLPPGAFRDQQVEELAAELSPMKAAQFATVLTRLEEIGNERAAAIAKERASYEQMKAQEKLQAEQQREGLVKTFQKVRADVTDKEKGLSVFREREGDAEWNKGVQERLAIAEAVYNGNVDREAFARNAYWGAAAPQLLMELNGQLQRNAELEKTIAELRAASPPPGGAKPGDSVPPQDNTKRGLDGIMDEIHKVLPGAR